MQGAVVIVPSLTRLFNQSLAIVEIPAEWTMANITPVPKSIASSQPSHFS